MEFLRDLFGNITSGIIRLAVTVGILAAAYFFILRPILDTTENVSDTINNSIHRTVKNATIQVNQAFGPHSAAAKALRQARRQAHKAAPNSSADRLLRCVQASHGNVNRIQRCTAKFSP